MGEFSNRLKAMRTEKGLTRQQLADSTGINVNTLRSYEMYDKEPNHRTLLKLARALNVSLDYLFGTSDRKTPLPRNLMFFSDEEEKMIGKYRNIPSNQQKLVSDLIETFFDLKNEVDEEEANVLHQRLVLPYGNARPSAGSGNEIFDEMSEIKVKETLAAKKADFVLQVDGRSMEPEFNDGDFVLVKRQDDVGIGEIGIWFADGEVYIKQRTESGLHSLNPDYPDVKLNGYSETKCYGKVIGKAEL